MMNDENQQQGGKCLEPSWYGGAKRWRWAIFRGKVANVSSFGRMMSSVMSYHKYLNTDPPLSHQTLRPIFFVFRDPKIGVGVPNVAPKCTGWPRGGGEAY